MSFARCFVFVRRFGLLFLLVAAVLAFYFLGGFEIVRLENLKKMHEEIVRFVEIHPLYAIFFFFAIYMIYTVSSIPGLFALDLVAGFLFGRAFGVVLVAIGASIGALLMFLAARYAFYEFFLRKAEGWVSKVKEGFDRNQKSYLFFLRIVPFAPFGIVNIVLAFSNVRTWTYLWTTALGILPLSFLHVHIGSSLGKFLAEDTPINASIVFNYEIILALAGFAALAFLPIAFRRKKS